MLNLPVNFINQFNKWTASQRPFVFLIDFEGKKPVLFLKEEAAHQGLFFATPKATNITETSCDKNNLINFDFEPVHFKPYQQAFQQVQNHLQQGDTYLLNLTCKSKLKHVIDLTAIFCRAKAPYRILWQNRFVSFSPESFIQTKGNTIVTFPMKGTISADLPHADQLLLNDKKENFEHHTIVDLLRNDLALLATNIQVKRFKFLQKIKTNRGNIWQMSSEIQGQLPPDWKKNAAHLFNKILPAGSISGAPKVKTLSIIKEVEQTPRGYYTGIFGFFNGQDFDTAVLIRYIEKNGENFYYRSGGGITALSQVKNEYDELIQKIYVPIT